MNYIIRFIGYIQIFLSIIVYYYYVVSGFILPNFWGLAMGFKITLVQLIITVLINIIHYYYYKKISWFYVVPLIVSIIPLIIFWIFKIENLRQFFLK